jgi:hypothetical protein
VQITTPNPSRSSSSGRVLVRFDYPTLSGPPSRGWILIERGDAEVCEKHSGGEEHLVVVVNDPLAFARWHVGELRWGDALRSGAIEVKGTRTLARTLPTWHRDSRRGPQPLHAPDPPTTPSSPPARGTGQAKPRNDGPQVTFRTDWPQIPESEALPRSGRQAFKKAGVR